MRVVGLQRQDAFPVHQQTVIYTKDAPSLMVPLFKPGIERVQACTR